MKSKSNILKNLRKRLRINKLHPALRNRYVLTSAAFLVWMLVFDDNTVIEQVKRRYHIIQQDQKIQYYQEEIAKVNEERDALFGNTASLERFARERYRMLKDGEDLYLVINK